MIGNNRAQKIQPEQGHLREHAPPCSGMPVGRMQSNAGDAIRRDEKQACHPSSVNVADLAAHKQFAFLRDGSLKERREAAFARLRGPIPIILLRKHAAKNEPVSFAAPNF